MKCVPGQDLSLTVLLSYEYTSQMSTNAILTLWQDGGLFTFGDGSWGQLGHGSTNNELLPRRVLELMGTEVSQITCGRSCLLWPCELFHSSRSMRSVKIVSDGCTVTVRFLFCVRFVLSTSFTHVNSSINIRDTVCAIGLAQIQL